MLQIVTEGFQRWLRRPMGARIACCWLLACATLSHAVSIGPQVPLTLFQAYALRGDVVVGGVGMRNRGSGTINVAVPPGATVVAAYLYWSVIAPQEPLTIGSLNGEPVDGLLIAQTGSACWPTLNEANLDPPTVLTWVFRADVTGMTSASNLLTSFPSGLTGGEGPTAPGATNAYPLLDGATLVVVYSLASDFTRNIVLYDGARSFFAETAATSLAWGAPGALGPVAARTVFVVADGQSFFGGDGASFNNVAVAGPGAAVRTLDAFDGEDGGGPVAPHGLWDTLTADISTLVAPGATMGTAQVKSGDKFDCLTWIAQVASVVTGLPPTTTTTTTTVLSSTTTRVTTSTITTSTTVTTTTATTVTTSTTEPTVPTTTTTVPTSTTTSTSSSSTTTTTTTSSTSTTTTTTTTTTSSTTSTTATTTTSTSSTTTTTAPANCAGPRAATYASIRCRLELLATIIATLPELDPYERLLGRRVARVLRSVNRSEEYLIVRHRQRAAHGRLRSALRGMISVGYRIDSLGGKRGISDATRTDLRQRADELRDDMRTLGLTLGGPL